MKAILEFNLPDEQDTYTVCVESGKFFSALCNIEREIDKLLNSGRIKKPTKAVLEEIRNLIPFEIHKIG